VSNLHGRRSAHVYLSDGKFYTIPSTSNAVFQAITLEETGALIT
jgi:hypothetical protein